VQGTITLGRDCEGLCVSMTQCIMSSVLFEIYAPYSCLSLGVPLVILCTMFARILTCLLLLMCICNHSQCTCSRVTDTVLYEEQLLHVWPVSTFLRHYLPRGLHLCSIGISFSDNVHMYSCLTQSDNWQK
jgi:hypothetical protein